MENILASKPSHKNLFENEMRMKIETLEQKMDDMKQRMISMDERQGAMFSMIRDIHSRF